MHTPRKVMKRWIAALRSGKYKQGKNALRTHDRFCCLGVLCDLNAKDGGAPWEAPAKNNTSGFYAYGDRELRLPDDLANYLKLNAYDVDELIYKNDNGSSFKEIANFLEKTYLPRL
jgi:hypothetical protein